MALYHDLCRHLFADGHAGFLDFDDQIAADGVHHRDGAAHCEAQVLQMLLHVGTAAHAPDDVLLACIRHNQRHHRFIPFLLSKQLFFL